MKRTLGLTIVTALTLVACGSDTDQNAESGGTGSAPVASPATTDDVATTTAPVASTPTDTEVSDDDADVADRTYGGTVTYGLEAEPTGLRPWLDPTCASCRNVRYSVFDPLARSSTDGDVQGWLAESIEPNEDFTVWTVTLRPDVVFHDGTPLTAQSLADMFVLQRDGAATSGIIAGAGLLSVEAVGELEAEYTLEAGNSAFPAVLSGPIGEVFEPGAAAADPVAFNTAPVGTGPFVMQSRDFDNETVVVRNENYWMTDAAGNQLPYLDSISFRPIPDESTRLDALLSDTVSIMMSRRQSTIRDARDQSGIELIEAQGNNSAGGMYNTAVAPFDDVRVRQALNHFIDQEAVISALGGEGISLPATQFFSPDSPWYTEDAAEAWPSFDFDAGVALLQDYVDDPERSDGKSPGEPIDVRLSCTSDTTLTAAMQVIEQVWSGSGLVNVTLSANDQATHVDLAITDQHQAHCWRWGSDDDPSVPLGPFLAPPEESPANAPNFFNPESYELSQEALRTDDFDERKELYKEIMLNLAEDSQIWFTGHTVEMVAFDPSIQGIEGWLLPSGDVGAGFEGATVSFQEVWIDG